MEKGYYINTYSNYENGKLESQSTIKMEKGYY